MKFPFVTRGTHERELRHRDVQLELVTSDRDYWKLRGERLIDAHLVRAGAIHQPTMEDRKSPMSHVNAASLIAGALSITEIDSSTFTKKAAS